MPKEQTTKETKILGSIAELLFGSHLYANITSTHTSGKIINERMRLLMKSSYWNSLQPKPVEKQIIKKVYQPNPEEKKSLESLCHYIEKQIQTVCTGTPLAVLDSSEARKRGRSKDKAHGILEKNQNQVERYLTVLRGLFNDFPEQPTTFPNPFRNIIVTSGIDGTEFGIATYSYSNTRYSLRLIVAAVWRAAADENVEWTDTLGNLSKDEATLTSKENFISVLAECLRAYNQDYGPNPFSSSDDPSCDLGAIERVLLRGAPYNTCLLPPPTEDQPNKLFEIKHSIDHYLIDKLEGFCTESEKALIFRVLSNKVLMDEPDVPSDEAYKAIFKRYQTSFTSNSEETEGLYGYLVKSLAGFPWNDQAELDTNLKFYLFQLMQVRVDLFTSIELDDPNGLMNAENQNSLNRLLMLGSRSLANATWIDIYQNMDRAKEFEQDRITLKALEELIDAEYCRCALAPGLLYTNKTQQRLNTLFSKCEEISSQFNADRGTNIKEQIDQLSQEKLKNEFVQEINHDTRHIIHYTLTSIDDRLQRLDKKCIDVTPESINTLYQASFETLWNDPLSTQEEPVLSIAPRGIRINQERYQQLDEKPKKQLAWGLDIAKLAACFDQNGHVDRKRDILRDIAAMRGQTLDSTDFEAETFGQERDRFLKKDIEDIIWITCSIIRELNISAEQKEIAWSTLEDACKNIDIFSRYILFEDVMEELKDFIKDKDKNIWLGLPDLFTNLEEAQIRLNSDWGQYANPLYQLPDLQGLVLLSLIRFMSALKLEKLHLANKQCFSLWCKLFRGNDAEFTLDEQRAFKTIAEENKGIEYTVNGLGEFLQQVIYLINQNEKFHASFAEGIITNMTRSRAEQLVNIVACFTKNPILCPRLSSSLPGKIVLTILEKRTSSISHMSSFSIEQYYDILNKGSFAQYQNTHIIIPGGNFDHKKILKEQETNHINIRNKYVKMSGDDSPSSSLGSALQNLNRYARPTYSNLPAKSTLFQENLDNPLTERETKRGLQPG